jgi:ABC-type sugar transport system substrate-binding protein
VVINTLQRNPDIDYLVPAFDTMFTGVPSALTQSGLESHISGAGTTVAGQVIFNAIQSGSADMVMATPTSQFGWQLADTTARLLLDLPIPTSADSPTGFNIPVQLIYRNNLDFDPNGEWVPWTGYKQAYRQAWGVS